MGECSHDCAWGNDMKTLMLLVLALGLAACSTNGVNTNYRGADSGALVFSTASVGDPQGFQFLYQMKGVRADCPVVFCQGQMINNPGSIAERREDFTGRESGWVNIHHLKPGTYEIYNFQVWRGNMFVAYSLSLRKDFSIPFTIEPGRTTYIGQYATVGRKEAQEVHFEVMDRSTRDLEIARKAEPTLPPVTIAVPDALIFESPLSPSTAP